MTSKTLLIPSIHMHEYIVWLSESPCSAVVEVTILFKEAGVRAECAATYRPSL